MTLTFFIFTLLSITGFDSFGCFCNEAMLRSSTLLATSFCRIILKIKIKSTNGLFCVVRELVQRSGLKIVFVSLNVQTPVFLHKQSTYRKKYLPDKTVTCITL